WRSWPWRAVRRREPCGARRESRTVRTRQRPERAQRWLRWRSRPAQRRAGGGRRRGGGGRRCSARPRRPARRRGRQPRRGEPRGDRPGLDRPWLDRRRLERRRLGRLEHWRLGHRLEWRLGVGRARRRAGRLRARRQPGRPVCLLGRLGPVLGLVGLAELRRLRPLVLGLRLLVAERLLWLGLAVVVVAPPSPALALDLRQLLARLLRLRLARLLQHVLLRAGLRLFVRLRLRLAGLSHRGRLHAATVHDARLRVGRLLWRLCGAPELRPVLNPRLPPRPDTAGARLVRGVA